MAEQHHAHRNNQNKLSSLSSADELPRDALIARTEVLWEVLALQLRPTEAETDALLASLPSVTSSNSSGFPSSSLDSVLQWTQPAPADASVIVLQTMRDLGIISTLQLDLREVAKLIISIRKLYRLPEECAYHNWAHASAVAHYACVLAYRLELTRRFASPLPVFALIIAALCHDMDHRGQTNVFNVNQRTIIWHAYAYSCTHIKSTPTTNSDNSPSSTSSPSSSSSNGPLLEVHHLTLCNGLFKTCYPHILDRLSPSDLSQFFKLIEVIILATDLVAHPRVVQSVKQLRPADLTSSAPFPLVPILSLFIGACDLNATARDWLSSLKAAQGIYTERVKEEALSAPSQSSSSGFAIVIPNVGQDQCLFLERFVRPIFVEITRLFPTSHPSLTAVDANLARWRKLSEEGGKSGSSKLTSGDLVALITKAEEEIRQATGSKAADIRKQTSPRSLRRAAAATTTNKRPKQSVHH